MATGNAPTTCQRPAAGSAASAPGGLPTVRLWRIDLADGRHDESAAAAGLTATERGRAARGIPAVRRRRVLLRGGLREALGGLLGLDPGAVPLDDDAGRPVLGTGPDLRVSCSASGHVGLVAIVAGAGIGVDVQQHRDDDARSACDEGWLRPSEQHRLGALPEPERPLAVTRCWTQKEAVLKGLGVGLRQHPATVETPVAGRGRIADWWAEAVPVAPGHVGTVVVRTPFDGIDLVVRDMIVGGYR